MFQFLHSALIGYGFGFGLQKARVFDPTVIQGQLLLQDFTMIQTFLAAVATSQLALAATSMLPVVGKDILAYREKSVKGGACRGFHSVAVGGSLLGVGMALAGACPGTIWAQVGSGIPGSSIVLAGASFGVLLYSMVERHLRTKLFVLMPPKVVAVERHVGMSYQRAALLSGTVLMAVSFLFRLAPNSVSSIQSGVDGWSWSFWTPQAAGALIGSLQVPSILLLDEALGMSYTLVSLLSPIVQPLVYIGIVPRDSELAIATKSSWKKLSYTAAVILGAYSAAKFGSTYGTAPGLVSGDATPFVTPIIGNGALQAFIGGIFLWVGARIQGGCTSGHGISGFSLLKKMSIMAVPAMFISGIITMNLLKLLS